MIIVIAGAKGGSGKTTTAIHLAEYLSRKHSINRVVLLDGDPDNKSASGWYNRGSDWNFELIGPDDGIPEYDVLVVDSGAAPDDEDLEQLLEKSDLLVIPTAPAPMDLESTLRVVLPFEQDGSVQVMITLSPPGRSRVGQMAIETLQENGISVAPAEIKRRAVLAEASGVGSTVAAMRGGPAKQAWNEYQAAFKHILKGVL